MKKAKKIKPIEIVDPEPIEDPEIVLPEQRKFALPFSGQNHNFYLLCKARMTYGKSVLLEGKQWNVDYARFERSENQFYISLIEHTDGE